MTTDNTTPTSSGGPAGAPDETFEYIEEVVEYRDTRKLRILLSVILAILILLLLGVGYALLTLSNGKGGAVKRSGVNDMVWVRSIYGWGNTEDKKLVTPNSVAIGPDGMLWTNSRNRYAVAFNADGTFDRILMSNPTTSSSQATSEAAGLSPMGEAAKPVKSGGPGVSAIFSLDVDKANNLYIGDDSQGHVMEFTPEGRIRQGWKIPGLVKMAANQRRVAVVSKGSLGVFEQATGVPVFSFGTRGQGDNEFDFPVGVHIDDAGNVYVADTQNRRVRKYAPSGRHLWDAGTPPDRTDASAHDVRSAAETKGLFELPTGVTTDANGRVIVTDAFRYQLVVLDGKTGKKIASYGEFGLADGQFNNPSAVAYDAARDYFLVADTDNNRLQVVRLPGSSNSAVNSTVRRAMDRPIWILCLPFLLLLIAALISWLVRRRRDNAGAQGETAA